MHTHIYKMKTFDCLFIKMNNENNIPSIKIHQWYFVSFKMTVLIPLLYIINLNSSSFIKKSYSNILKTDFALL